MDALVAVGLGIYAVVLFQVFLVGLIFAPFVAAAILLGLITTVIAIFDVYAKCSDIQYLAATIVTVLLGIIGFFFEPLVTFLGTLLTLFLPPVEGC